MVQKLYYDMMIRGWITSKACFIQVRQTDMVDMTFWQHYSHQLLTKIV
jgi:hypothetical protein